MFLDRICKSIGGGAGLNLGGPGELGGSSLLSLVMSFCTRMEFKGMGGGRGLN